VNNVPTAAEIAARARQVREKTVADLPGMIEQAKISLASKGCRVYVAQDAAAALDYLAEALRGKKTAVQSRALAAGEIGLAPFLAGKGMTVTRSNAGEWVLSLLGRPPAHPRRPAAGLERLLTPAVLNKIVEEGGLRPYLSAAPAGIAAPAETAPSAEMAPAAGIAPPASEVFEAVRKKIRQAMLEAEVGITGADAVAVETGTIFLAEDDGDARIASNLPYTHVVVAGVEKLTGTIADALAVIRAVSLFGFGRPLTRYVTGISGPSRTADIEFKITRGMHGPKEVHVVLLDNGRMHAAPNGFAEALYCLHCGFCLGPAAEPGPPQTCPAPCWPYPGAVGKLLAALLGNGRRRPVVREEEFSGCPLGISIPEIIKGN